MTDEQAKFIVAGIIFATMEPIEDETVCPFDVAVSMAQDLYDHVAGDSEELHSALPAWKSSKGPAN